MTCPKTEFWLADRLAGDLDDADAGRLDQHLRSCPDCRAEAERFDALWDALGDWPDEEPSPRLRERFEGMLAAQRGARPESPRARNRRRRLLAWAAMIAVALGGFAAGRGWRDEPSGDAEIQALREEVATLNRLVSLTLLARDSAGHRLRGVSYARRARVPDAELVDTLLQAAGHDDSTNVRLAAVETLRSFEVGVAPRPRIRALLTPDQPPMVQIALLDFLLAAPQAVDRDAVRRFRQRPELDRDVRDHIDQLLETEPRGTAL